MKTMYLLAALLTVTSIQASVPDDVSEFSLSNGIQVITRTVDNNEIEGLSLFIIGGSSALGSSTQGLERFALECAMMGSGQYPGPAWRELMDLTQAEWTSNFNYDFSRYHLRCISDDLPVLLEAFGDCLLDPELDPAAVEQVRESIVHNMEEEYNDPDSWIWFVANDAFMPGHTYRNLPAGTVETVSGFTVQDVEEMLSDRIRTGNLLITHAGPTTPDELRDILETAFFGIPEGGTRFEPVVNFHVPSDTLVLQHREVPTAYAVVKFNAPPQGDPDLVAFNAAMSVVSDLLWQVLRTDNALTYATYAGSTTYQQNWGYMYVSSPEPLLACSLMADVMAGVIDHPVDEGIVRGSIEKARTWQNVSAAGKATQCWMLGNYQICSGDWRNAYLVQDQMENLTSSEISAVLDKWVGNAGWGIIADTTVMPAEDFQAWTIRGMDR